MDPKRFKQTYERLQSLDERLTYRVRPAHGGGLRRAGLEQIEERQRLLAEFTIELKEIVDDLMRAIASKPPGS